MPEDVCAKVRKLIAVAVHPSSDETSARNAALAACKLIDKFKLLDGEAPAPRTAFEEFIQNMADSGAEVFVQGFYGTTRPPPQPKVAGTPAKAPRRTVRRYIAADEPVHCSRCGQRISRGRQVVWDEGLTYHADCHGTGR